MKTFEESEVKKVFCESFNDYDFGHTVGAVKTCFMQVDQRACSGDFTA